VTRMLKWLMVVSLLSSGSLLAQPVELKYAHQPAPAYPRSLYEQRVSGLVLVEFRGHSNGAITDVSIIDSSHHSFAKSVQRAVPGWRLKSWEVGPAMPESITVRQELYFTHSSERQEPHRWIRRHVRVLSCNTFNKALKAFRANSPDHDLRDMHLITYTFRVLGKSATRLNMTDDQRAELGDDFVRAIPDVIQRCEAQPRLRYKEALPDKVRELI
jgi:TonB family protein